MRLGLHISSFTWPGGPARLGADVAAIARGAEDAGFDRVSVMDHVWQIGGIGPPEQDMLEAYTALGYLAAVTSRVKLLTLVTGVTYRDPGMLIKSVTTLDVLSGGRAMLGIGAAWNEEEARGLGLFFPPLAERFERLEETLQIALRMWGDDETPYEGKHYHLARPLNSPQPLSRPHPPIMIGGSGEKKTLRLVARYAQSWNVIPRVDLRHKLDVLRRHCEEQGRSFDDIEKTVLFNFDVGERGERVDKIIDGLRQMAGLGFTVAHGSLRNASNTDQFAYFADRIIPAVADL
jgi:F420-dependent oxidoreductase-like protein